MALWFLYITSHWSNGIIPSSTNLIYKLTQSKFIIEHRSKGLVEFKKLRWKFGLMVNSAWCLVSVVTISSCFQWVIVSAVGPGYLGPGVSGAPLNCVNLVWKEQDHETELGRLWQGSRKGPPRFRALPRSQPRDCISAKAVGPLSWTILATDLSH